MFSSCSHMGDLFVWAAMHLWITFPSHPSSPFFSGYIFILKPALNSSLSLAAHLGFILVTIFFFAIMRGFSQIVLISLPSLYLWLLLSVSLLPSSLQILMSARSTMEAASTDVLTPGAPTTANAIPALACTWMVAPVSVRNITALWKLVTHWDPHT